VLEDYTIPSKSQAKIINNHFPLIDTTKPITKSELKSVMMVIYKKESQISKKNRHSCRQGKENLKINDWVTDGKHKRLISNIAINGFLVFSGKKGIHNPRNWKITDGPKKT
jgi:hypothetical protein